MYTETKVVCLMVLNEIKYWIVSPEYWRPHRKCYKTTHFFLNKSKIVELELFLFSAIFKNYSPKRKNIRFTYLDNKRFWCPRLLSDYVICNSNAPITSVIFFLCSHHTIGCLPTRLLVIGLLFYKVVSTNSIAYVHR